MREIGAETVGLWKYFIQTRLQEVMPWYVDLHNRLDNMADIFLNQFGTDKETMQYGHQISKSGTDTTTITDKTDDTGTVDKTGSDTGTVENVGTNDRSGQNLYSDTPQNGLQQVIAGNYLTNATVDSDTTSIDNTETRNLANAIKEVRALTNLRSGTSALQHGLKDTHSGNDIRTLERSGFMGDKVDMLTRYKELHLNIMMEIVNSVADCFMGIY